MTTASAHSTISDVPRRALSLDALRGFAILTMVLSGVVPYGNLPAWMYHAQLPPPAHTFTPDLPGLTWVDLVFPLFLFALGAAIPLALSRRMEKGESPLKIFYYITERGFLLGFFAIFLRHIRPHVLNPTPENLDWFIALLGFILMFGLFARLPGSWSIWIKIILKTMSWLGAIILLATLHYPDGTGFSLYRSDIIIVVLTNCAIFGAFLWWFTRNNLLLRLGILGILLGFRLAGGTEGWVQVIWNTSPIPWMYKLYYLQYLFIVIPGTIVGDLLLNWMHRPPETTSPEKHWESTRLISIALLNIVFIIILLVGLQARWLWQTTLLSLFFCILGWFLVRRPLNASENLLRHLLGWGIYFLILGLVFEPFEGGIKKDKSTLSYYFITTGMSVFLLITFYVLIDIWGKRRALSLLIDNGKNPMIAYVGLANFIWPIFAFTGVDTLLLRFTQTPWLGFFRGLFYTILLAYVVKIFTRRKIFWKT